MTNLLNEVDFTNRVAEKLSTLGILAQVPEPLVVSVPYGENEPVLTLRLESVYQDYKAEPDKLDVILLPLVTEVGWTVNGKRYNFADIAEHTLPLMRDLKRSPFEGSETQAEPGVSKGPIIYQELVNRPEERVVAQFVLAKNEIILPLHTGDMLRSYPDPGQFSSIAVQNLRRVVSEIGLTLSEYQIENFGATPWLVGFRGGRYRQFISSMITVPEVMSTLEKTLNSTEGLAAILPTRDKLIITTNLDDTAVCEMGLLAKYLKDESDEPVSSFVWHFKDGALRRVQTIELSEEEIDVPPSEDGDQ
jgi:hypothetical protein